jgi:hypothetical protein
VQGIPADNEEITMADQTSPTTEVKPADVRAWAQEQGLEVADRGRIAASVYEAYAAAHQG